MLATIGAFRVISDRDLHDARDASLDPRDDTLEHLRDEGLIRFVAIDGSERAAVLMEGVLAAFAQTRLHTRREGTRSEGVAGA